MATALAERAGNGMPTTHTSSPGFRSGTTCDRCGGLMVGEFCLELLNSASESEVEALRCVQCGEVVDPVILQNRRRQQKNDDRNGR